MSEVQNLLNVDAPPSSEIYAMECKLSVSRHETMGDAKTETKCEWSGYSTLEVVSAMLDIMGKVVGA